jgi:hypothetical protein
MQLALAFGVNALSIYYSSFTAISHIGLLIWFGGTPKASGSTHYNDYIFEYTSYSFFD